MKLFNAFNDKINYNSCPMTGGISYTKEETDRLLNIARQLEADSECKADFDASSPINDKCYNSLFDLVSTFPSIDPKNAWTAIRNFESIDELNKLNNAIADTDEKQVNTWIHDHLPVIEEKKERKTKLDAFARDDMVEETAEQCIEKAKSEIENIKSAETKSKAELCAKQANEWLIKASDKSSLHDDDLLSLDLIPEYTATIIDLRRQIDDAMKRFDEPPKAELHGEAKSGDKDKDSVENPILIKTRKQNAELSALYQKLCVKTSADEAEPIFSDINKKMDAINRLHSASKLLPSDHKDLGAINTEVDNAKTTQNAASTVFRLLSELKELSSMSDASNIDRIKEIKTDWDTNGALLKTDSVKETFDTKYKALTAAPAAPAAVASTAAAPAAAVSMAAAPAAVASTAAAPAAAASMAAAPAPAASTAAAPAPAAPAPAAAATSSTTTEPYDVESSPIIEPDTTNPREEFPYVYNEIDSLAISPEQADEAKSYADVVLNSPEDHPREYDALTGADAYLRTRCIRSMLTTANRRLGYRTPVSRRSRDNVEFSGGVSTQSRNSAYVRNSLIMPTGFGLNRNSVLWNVPIITDFGYPFLNFSSDALMNIIQSKSIDDDIKNDQLKKMFKDAAKRYGGIWKAVYSSPLYLIRMIAQDIGIRCTPKALKIDGQALIDSEPGSTVNVTPIKYYSVDAAYDSSLAVPRDYLTTFYDVMDYSSTSKSMYLRFANGMTDEDFAEETDDNNGIPPFYILVPKKAKYSKCPIRSGSLLGSLLNVILGRKKCTMVKTIFQGKRGCLAMESKTADILFAET